VLETSVKVLELEARSLVVDVQMITKIRPKRDVRTDHDFIRCVKQILIRTRRWASNQSQT
jgi:hypothetical protein